MLQNTLRIVMAALCAWRALGEPVHFRLQLLLKQRVCSAIHAMRFSTSCGQSKQIQFCCGIDLQYALPRRSACPCRVESHLQLPASMCLCPALSASCHPCAHCREHLTVAGTNINLINSCDFPITAYARAGSSATNSYGLSANGGYQQLQVGSSWVGGLVWASSDGNQNNAQVGSRILLTGLRAPRTAAVCRDRWSTLI